MTENHGFFGSAVGDTREYDQLAMAAVWKRLLRDGVFEGVDSELAVSASSPAGMSVSLATGWAWVQGYWYENDAAKTLTIGAANPTLPRIDRIILRLDVLSGRTVGAVVLAGTPAASPSAPSLTQTADTWEISLAQVAVAAGATSIVAGNITDERWDATLCGYAEPHAVGLESVAVREDKDMGGSYTLTNLPAPGAATEVATKGYVDEIIGAATNIIAVSGKTYLCVNATWTGSAWNRLSTGSPAWAIELSHSGDAITVKHAAAGANPISWTDLYVFSNASDLKVTSISERVGSAGIVLNHVLDASAGGIKGGMVNQTGSRALNSSYQNTGAGERTVQVGLDGTGSGYFQAWISANGSAWTIAAGGANAVYKVGTVFVVPSGYYYKVTATAATLDAWWERG
ncbi:MAG: hypothetical protein WC683_07570 [bacterium]